jgi:hypothetical protein
MVVFFVLTVLAFPFLPSGGTVPRWAFLSLICAWFLFKIRIPPLLILFAVYLTVMAYIAPVVYEAAFIFWHFLVLAVLFCWAQHRNKEEYFLEMVTIGAALGMTVNSVVVLIQAFTDWQGIPQLIPNSGLFYNHNMGAEAAAMVLALVVGYRLWWLVPGLLPTLWFASRAPILSLGIAGGLALWRISRFAAMLVPLGCALFVFGVMKGEGGFRGVVLSADFLQRVGVWTDMLPQMTVWGHGLGSFIVDYPAFQRHTSSLMLRFENAHNDYLQVAYEMGLAGMLLIAILLAWMAAAPRSPAWYAMIVFLGEAAFGFPLYEPVSGALAACCAAVVFSGCTGLRDFLPARRSRIWARVADYGTAPFRLGVYLLPTNPLTPFSVRLRNYTKYGGWGYPGGQEGHKG